jgi:hypothetical protein
MDELGDLVMTRMEEVDIEEGFKLLEPLVCISKFSNEKERQQRRLGKLIKYYVSNWDAYTVKRGDELVGIYLGKGNDILHIASKGNDVKAVVLLMYNVLWQIQEPSEVTKFVPIEGSEYQFSSTYTEKVDNFYHIKQEYKDKIKNLYKILKG